MEIIDNLTAPYIGESEELIRGVFDEARARMQKTNKSTILFFDEFRRFVVSGNDGFSKAVIDEFKSELDGLNKNTYSVKGKTYRVFVIGTTNNINDIDKGLLRPGRATVLNIPLPNKEERTEFFKRYLAEKYTIGDINYDKLAAMTEGLAGADIKIGIVGGTLADILMKRILGDDLNEKNISELKKINPKKDVRLRFDQATLEVAVTSYNPKKTEAPTNIYA
jgi:ATP-dependent 26S proteasome regulatory subunit